MIDFHTHVLPSIDDGPANTEDSYKLVDMMSAQGIKDIVCTPHFIPGETDYFAFVEKRDKAIKIINEKYSAKGNIRLISGAEIFCNEHLLFLDDYSKLCIGDTNNIMLEFPYNSRWNRGIWQVIEHLIQKKSLNVIIAHAERYKHLKKHSYRYMKKLIDMNCIIQINCDFASDTKDRYKTLELIDKGFADIIGTDSHGTERRKPYMAEAKKIITEKYGENTFAVFQENASVLLNNKKVRKSPIFF